MEHYAAIDVSLEWSSICIVDPSGQIVREAKVRSEREAVVDFFQASRLTFARIGLEAGPLSQWLHAGLIEAGLPAICIETRHVKAALKAMTVKTDKSMFGAHACTIHTISRVRQSRGWNAPPIRSRMIA
jgi:transposase